MALRKRRRNRYKFTEKSHSKKGMIATGMASALLIVYIIFIMLAFRGPGKLSMYYGSVGCMAIVATIGTFVVAIQSMREEDSFPLFPRLALGLSMLSAFSWIGTYTLGVML